MRKKYFVAAVIILLTLLSSGTIFADTVTYPGDYVTGNLITAAGINNRFTRLYNVLDGADIDNTNLKNDAASLFKVSGGVLTSSGGNIGIGETNPTFKLQIISDGTNSYPFVVTGSNNPIFVIYETSNGDGRAQLKDSSNTIQVDLHTNGSSYLNGGNVGIGTTSPYSLLSVVKNQENLLQITRNNDTEDGTSAAGILQWTEDTYASAWAL